MDLRKSRFPVELGLLFDALPDLLFRLNPDGIIMNLLSGDSADLHQEPHEFLGKRIVDCLPEEVGPLLQDAIDESMLEKRMTTAEYALSINGEEKWFEARILPSDDDYCLCLVRNISGIKLRELELKKSETRFMAAFEQAAVGMAKVSGEGRFIRVNRRFDEILGYEPGELLGRTVFDVIHPDEWDERHEFLTTLKTRQMSHFKQEKQFIGKDGRKIWVRNTGSGVFDEQGQHLYNISVLEDISEQKHAEAARLKSETRFMATFDHAAVGIGHVDNNGRWLRLNRRYCGILGYEQDELMGLTFQDVTHPDDVDADNALFASLKAREIPSYSIEKRYLRKDGGIVWVNLTVSLVRDEGEGLDYAIAAAEDITARKQAEAELLQSKEALKQYAARLEESNRELEQFAAIASHDLKSPLRKILFFSEMLNGEQNAEQEFAKQRMHAAISKMQTFIDNLLTYSRLNRPSALLESVDLNEVITGAVENLSLNIESSNALLVLGEMESVEGDARQLTRVFQNLIENAMKFRKEGVKPVVKVFGHSLPDDRYEIRVEDNGIGFRPEDLDRIFKPFERLQTARNYDGTGLGLAIVQKIIEQRHGGRITASSAPDQGTVFTIQMPMRQGVHSSLSEACEEAGSLP